MSSAAANDGRNRARKLIDLVLDRLLGTLAAVTLFAMMLVTFVDVVGRYVFSLPIPGGFELTEVMMATLIFLGLPMVTADQEHVTVDLLDRILPVSARRVQHGLVNLLSTLAFAVISWRLWDKAVKTAEYGDDTPFLHIPLAPLVYFLCLMTGLTAVILLLIALRGPGPARGAEAEQP